MQKDYLGSFHTISVIGFGIGLAAIVAGIILSMQSGFAFGRIIGISGAVLAATCLIAGIITNALIQINIYIVFGALIVGIGGLVWYLIVHKKIATVAVAAKTQLQFEHNALIEKHEFLLERHKELMASKNELEKKHDYLTKEHHALQIREARHFPQK